MYSYENKDDYIIMGRGWASAMREAFNKLLDLGAKDITYDSKWAELTVCCDCDNLEADKIISKLEDDCRNTCENCGKPGTEELINDWLYILCPECTEAAKKGDNDWYMLDFEEKNQD